MAQNTSHAVMQQRAEAHDSLDEFPTPPWATRALLLHVLGAGSEKARFDHQSVGEPDCNRGFMVDPLGEYFWTVWATDIFNYGLRGRSAARFPFAVRPSRIGREG